MVRQIRAVLALALLVVAYFSLTQIGNADTNNPFWTVSLWMQQTA